MAAFVKSIAPMQLLGLGDEGFATSLNNQDPSTLVAANPGAADAVRSPALLSPMSDPPSTAR